MIHKSFFLFLWIWFSHGVFDVKTDEIKLLSVTEGHNVTLNTDVTEVHKNDQILWMFQINNSDTRIAEIHKQVIDMYDSNEKFGDRLQMDSRTGSLTIINIRSEYSGLYKLQIIRTGVTYKSFSVAVYGNSLLSSISVSDLSISLSLPLEVEYQDKNTYSCVINNPISNQTQHLDNSQLFHMCPELMQQSQSVVLLVSIVIVLVLAVVVAVLYLQHRKCKQPRSEETQ